MYDNSLVLFYANRIFGSFVICLVFAFIVLEGVRFAAMGVKGSGLGMLIMDTAYLGVTV